MTTSRGPRVRVTVPATSGNVGPGFDVLGLALGLYNVVELAPAEEIRVEIAGLGAGRLPRDGENLVVRGARLVHEEAGREFGGLHVRQVNGIPPARGLGSSATAWLAGMLGANALLGEPLSRDQVLDLAIRQEGHPDNLAAALHGGLTVTCWDGEARTIIALPVPPGLEFALLVPGFEASTTAARAALPPSYPRADAVYNVGRVALLLAAWTAGRFDVLGVALGDRLHQPYRARALFPWLPGVMEAARAAGAFGAALSGAGPSVLALTPVGLGAAVASAMADAFRTAGHAGEGQVLAADSRGARVDPVPVSGPGGR